MKTERPIATVHDESGSPPSVEDEINRLMETYGLNRQQAEDVMKRRSTPHIRRHPVEAITQEEMDSLLEEIARSGQNMSIFGKKNSHEDKQQDK